jgi:glycosyltransferase involved in cell wall biosynthesis
LPTDRQLSRDVVLFSTADWDHPFWTNKQHVASQLAAEGFRVLYIESLGLRRPTAGSRDLGRIGRRLRRALGGLRRVNDNLWIGSPLALPWHGNRLARSLNERLLRWWLKRQCRRLGFQRPIVWTYNPLVGPLIESLDRSLLVYHCVDDLSAAPHMPAEVLHEAERDLARAADVNFATSRPLEARLAAIKPDATHFLANVADYDHFSRARATGPIPDELAAIPRPRLGFIGAISNYKVDFELIATVARARPDWHWVLIGQVGEGQPDTTAEPLRLPNVHLLGPRQYSRLPDYLRGFDVATIPARANPYTAAMFPMKFFEYLAAGVPVVASSVPALAEFSRACELTRSPDEFVAAVARVLGGQRPVAEYCDELARQFTWEWRMGQMLEILDNAARTQTVLRAATF